MTGARRASVVDRWLTDASGGCERSEGGGGRDGGRVVREPDEGGPNLRVGEGGGWLGEVAVGVGVSNV